MAIDASENTGTLPVRAGYELDLARLTTWLNSHVDGFHGPLSVAQYKGGQSNPTYKLSTPAKNYVLRRQPPGPILAGAHAVDREARVMAALKKQGIPVPDICALCNDQDILGTKFFIMEEIEGRIFWDATLSALPIAQRALYFDAMNATIAQLHLVDPDKAGLGNFGRRGDYFSRQIARWSKQYDSEENVGRNPDMDRLIDWLPNNIPSDGDEVRIVHGDFRIDNLIFHPTEPRVIAILDWELSTLGHPLSDFAYNAMMYRMPPHIVAGLAGADIQALGLPSEQEYIAAYCCRTGRDQLEHFNFYVAFNFFRLAAILHGILGRIARGTASSSSAERRAAVFPELAKLAWAQAIAADAS